MNCCMRSAGLSFKKQITIAVCRTELSAFLACYALGTNTESMVRAVAG